MFYRTTLFIWQHTPCLEHFSSPPKKTHKHEQKTFVVSKEKTSFHNEPKINENMTHQKKTRCKLAWWWGKTNQYKIPLLLFGDSGGTSAIGRNFFCEKIERAKCSKKATFRQFSIIQKRSMQLAAFSQAVCPPPLGVFVTCLSVCRNISSLFSKIIIIKTHPGGKDDPKDNTSHNRSNNPISIDLGKGKTSTKKIPVD